MRWAHALDARGLPASHVVVHDGGAAVGVDRLSSGVLVATSRRDSDGHRHLHITTRDLIHRGRHPVLVVPDRLLPGSHVEELAASGPLALPT
jgi:hypothetical protein